MGRLGEILVDMKACTSDELRAGLQTQAIFGGRIGTNLLELGIIDESQLAAALTKAHGLPCLTGDVEPEQGAIDALPAQLVERYGAVPIHSDERRLRVVISDPRDLPSLDELAFRTGKKVEPVLAAEARLWALMRRFYGIDRRLRGLEVADDLEDAATARGGRLGIAAVPGDASAEGPRPLPQREALDLIGQMRDPVVLSALLVRSAGSRAGRAVFLKVHGRRAVAWLGAGPRLEGDVRGAAVKLDDEGPFGPAAELRTPVLAPVRPSRGAAGFFEALGAPLPMNAFVAPVILRRRAV
ncbi:MAG TPA: hypothetical protein VIW03_09045, partial [Anaeromyxobacter sp.]